MQTMPAHWFTLLIIGFTFSVTPMYWFLILPRQRAVLMAWLTAVIGAVLLTCNMFNIVGRLGDLGGPFIGALWIILPLIVWTRRKWFQGLTQRPIVALQIFRVIGGLFMLEMARGHIPTSFALPAGIGDLIVGLVALWVVVKHSETPRWGVVTVLVIGVADFIMAFFFGFTSMEGPAQLFAVGFDNKLSLFPTGLIPLFLVPYAITFHVLSWINFRQR